MRPWHYYTIAALLVLASIPIYRFIWRHASGAVENPQVASVILDDRSPAPLVSYPDARVSEAEDAMRRGRARCVAGVVYRTYDHVIEPWPGHVRCTAQ